MAMNRRNVLIGLGTIAVGGGAAFGSGAFSSVEANRTVTVQLAGDGSALLGLDPLNTAVASTTDGTIELDFATIGTSSGINYDAVTEWRDLFRITNNGNDDVTVYLGTTTNSAGNLAVNSSNGYFFYDSTSDGETADDPLFEFYLRGTGMNSVPAQGDADAFVGSGNAVTVTSGSSKDVQARFDTRGVDSSVINSTTELINEVQIVAEV